MRQGHGCVTLVINARTGELLHMDDGKKKGSLASFFAKLTEERKASIKAVCIHRNGGLAPSLKSSCHMPKSSTTASTS